VPGAEGSCIGRRHTGAGRRGGDRSRGAELEPRAAL